MRKAAVLVALAALNAAAFAGFTDINSAVVRPRYAFNHFPNSSLVINNNFPAQVNFLENNFGASDPNAGDFANMHEAALAVNGVVYQMQNSEPFEFRVDAYLECLNLPGQRKEAGIAMHSDDDPFLDNLFIITSDGEVAAFGGQFPFQLFGPAGTYVPGTLVEMGLKYTPDDDPIAEPGDAATIEYFYNGVSSGVKEFTNTENGFIDGTELVVYLQNNPDSSFAGDFAFAEYTNFSVPEPAALALLGLVGVLGLRRR